MSPDVAHSLAIARTLAVEGDARRAIGQLDRVRTLDVHGHAVRQVALLRMVVWVRTRELALLQQAMAELEPLSDSERRSFIEMLLAAPEAEDPEYRRYVGRFQEGGGRSASKQLLLRPRQVLLAVAALAVLVALGTGVWAVWPRSTQLLAPERALETMLSRLQSGNFGELWAALPDRFRQQGDLALRAVMSQIPDRAFDDFRAIDRGLARVIDEQQRRLSASRVESIGPVFRTLSGEDDARALARYLQRLSSSRLYDKDWLQKSATVESVIGEVETSEFATCWRTYFRRPVLGMPVWTALLGIDTDHLGTILSSPKRFAIARPDDGSGRVIVAILTPGDPGRYDIPMRLVDGVWIPEVLARNWEVVALQARNDPAVAQEILAELLSVRPDFDFVRLDRSKLLLLEAERSRSQEEFDRFAKEYVGGD